MSKPDEQLLPSARERIYRRNFWFFLSDGILFMLALGVIGGNTVIPDFVRASMIRLGMPGYRVLRWEKEHDRFRDPATWPEVSVATSGTHDTDSAVEWWESMPEWEREQLQAVPGLRDVPPCIVRVRTEG